MAKKFDPNDPYPFVTRNGYEVLAEVFESKILGVVKYDKDSGFLAEWDLKGRRVGIHKREKGEKHDLDLLNMEISDAEHGTSKYT